MNKKIVLITVITLLGGGILYLNKPQESNTKELTNETLKIENSMAIYLKGDDNEYHQIKVIPEGNYVLNTDETYCTEPENPDNKITGRVAYDSGTQTLSVSTLTKKNTKCYLYFEEKVITSADTLDMLNQSSRGEVDKFSGTACGGSCDLDQNGIYQAEDDFGMSYYYRGTVDNNWVVFGKDITSGDNIWWRIIRINGNGTIRLMYAGTSSSTKVAPSTTGDGTMIKPKKNTSQSSYPNAVYFNQTYNDNKYVGYMYPGNTGSSSANFDGAHKVDKASTKSDALTQIELWYNQDTNLGDLAKDYIDVDTGFCSDSSLATGNHGSYTGNGFGRSQSAYAGLDRVWQSGSTSTANPQTPTFKCGYKVSTSSTDKDARKRDLYTGPNATTGGTKGSNGESVEGNNALPVPVGLITIDEVIYAGGFYGKANANYWLKTDKYYWTMSPCTFYGSDARVFNVHDNGDLSGYYVGNASLGVRPVINLKADITLTTASDGGEGSRTNPYIVNTD